MVFEMRSAPDTAGANADLTRIALRVSNELGDGLRRKRWVHRQDPDLVHDTCDGHNVAVIIKVEIIVESGIYRIIHARQEKRVAVRRGSRDDLEFCQATTSARGPILL
jgi:hypothetical protein